MLRANAPAMIRRKTAAVACIAVRVLRSLVCENLPSRGLAWVAYSAGRNPTRRPTPDDTTSAAASRRQRRLEVQLQGHGQGQVRYEQRHEADGDRCRGDAQAPRDQTETEALHGDLPDQSEPARPQGPPNRHLATANRCVGEQKARDVGADDEQESADQSRQDGQRPEGDRGQACFVRGPDRQGPRLSGESRPILGVGLMKASSDDVKTRLCLVNSGRPRAAGLLCRTRARRAAPVWRSPAPTATAQGPRATRRRRGGGLACRRTGPPARRAPHPRL